MVENCLKIEWMAIKSCLIESKYVSNTRSKEIILIFDAQKTLNDILNYQEFFDVFRLQLN